MKILAVRGCDLASLAGTFEVDLAQGPLGAAGVFAIVGPTGAGKSTLLDAICVALFDRTPRLAQRSSVLVGRGDDDPTALSAHDVRSLLRRGASQGWAEVDFEGRDDRRYRARWSVKRARNAVDGRFQNQQMTLTSLDGSEQFGGTRTETLDAIEQRLGLSFDQFRRSALLAQGEFAAFLRADGKDRSELLERMTGTEIYSRLSIEAHLRASRAAQQLREQEGAALAIAVLSEDEHAHAVVALADAVRASTSARARLATAEAAARWLAEAERREQAHAQADAARLRAERAFAEAEPQRAELALYRRAEALRSAWDEVGRLDHEQQLARASAGEARELAAGAELAQRDVEAERTALAALHAPVREARVAAGLVESARSTARGPGVSGPSEARALAMRARAAEGDARWLVDHAPLAALVAGWPELGTRLAQRDALVLDLQTSERALRARAQEREGLARQCAEVASAHDQAGERLAEVKARLEALLAEPGLTLEQARHGEDDARRRCGEGDLLVALAADARAAALARSEIDPQLAAHPAADEAELAGRRRAEADRERATTLRGERSRMVEELRKAAGHAHARTELVEGEPCPLCGATAHPWRDRGSFDSLIGEAQARLDEAIADGEAALATLIGLDARAAQRARDHARLVAERDRLDELLRDAGESWQGALEATDERARSLAPASVEAEAIAGERQAAARGALEAARAARGQAEERASASSAAHAAVQARRSELEEHARALRDLDAERTALDLAAERVRGERASKLGQHQALCVELDAGLARWQGALAGLPGAAAGAAVGDGLARGDGRSLEPDVRQIASRIEVARGALARLRDDGSALDDLDDALGPCRDAVEELAGAWGACAGRVAALDAELVEALAALDDRARAAERTLVEERARSEAATARSEAAHAQLDRARGQLEADRIAAGLDAQELQRALTAPPEQVAGLAAHLDALGRAADRERTLCAERRRHLDEHASASPFREASPEHAAALREDAAQVELLTAEVNRVDHEAAARRAALEADAEARARRAASLAAVAEAAQAAEADRALGQLIGSHDGKLFRSFAQSLTLDGLLGVANAHLVELVPRYRLARVPGHDLEIQVIDRDLGDEIRSVQSLSGGESFLVSLALALGLSSMSAHDVRVRTLLIDEGFGTLDPATLDTALAVLDALQATGRQVGVISHVPALVERVGAHVRVVPRGNGRSEVVVRDA